MNTYDPFKKKLITILNERMAFAYFQIFHIYYLVLDFGLPTSAVKLIMLYLIAL